MPTKCQCEYYGQSIHGLVHTQEILTLLCTNGRESDLHYFLARHVSVNGCTRSKYKSYTLT